MKYPTKPESIITTDDEVARLRQRLTEMERGSISGVCRELRLQLDAAEARVKELEEYKRRVELSIKASSAFMDDEVIRRKQAEALRWAAAVLPYKTNSATELHELADAIEKGEVEV